MIVTGSSSGFGLSMVKQALGRGDKVVATLRTTSALDDLASQYNEDQLLIVQLDVVHPSAIQSAFAKAKEAFGRVDIVFNNAGVGLVGEVESTPEQLARNMFDVNFWGAVNVNKEAVKFFREENPPGIGGRLLVNSSYTGHHHLPTIGYYCAAKAGALFV